MRTSLAAMPIVLAMLGACATQADRAAQQEKEIDEMVKIYGPACRKLGFESNTDAWRNCIINLSQKDAVRSSTYYGPAYWRYPYWAY